MRLWHYKLIPLLPKSQLARQWRELNSIYKNQDRHILINYVYKYDKSYLYSYSLLVIGEMKFRGCKINKWGNLLKYFDECVRTHEVGDSLYNHFPEHNDRYLLENFYNLQEKYYAGQKDFSKETYDDLCGFVKTQGMEIVE